MISLLIPQAHRGSSFGLRPAVQKYIIYGYLSSISLMLGIGTLSWYRSGGSPDFAHIYAEVRLIRRYSPSEMYDLDKQRIVQKDLFEDRLYGGQVMPFIQPPFTLLLLSPLGDLSYAEARLIWLVMNLVLIALIPWALIRWNIRVLKPRLPLIFLGLFSFYPFFVCLWQGQISVLVLWSITGFLLLLRARKEFWAGVALGLGLIRFHLIYLIILFVIVNRRLQVILGVALAAGFMFASSFVWVGAQGCWSYLSLLKRVSADSGALLVSPEKFQNWVGQLYLLGLPADYRLFASATFSLIAAVLICFVWKPKWDPQNAMAGLHIGAVLTVAVLASPYLFIHDLSIFFPVLVLCIEYLFTVKDWGWDQRTILILLLLSPLVWFASLLISQTVPLQCTVVWMTIILCLLTRILRRSVMLRMSGAKPLPTQ